MPKSDSQGNALGAHNGCHWMGDWSRGWEHFIAAARSTHILGAASGKLESHHLPVLGIDFHGSAGGRGLPFCKISIEISSGERTKAMFPSRGGRLIVTPAFISCSHSA